MTNLKMLHLELTSKCNARCPECLRNYYGTSFVRPGLVETELSLDSLDKILSDNKLKDLKKLLINGNYGDIVMHSKPLEAIELCRSKFPKAEIKLHTNGGALKESFWEKLASLDIIVDFGIDGLADTHHIYRRNTSFETVIKNAKSFINAGGRATWMMTVFKHNQHQIEECEKLSKILKFKKFSFRYSTRGEYEYRLGLTLKDNFELDYILEPADALNLPRHESPITFYKDSLSMKKRIFLSYSEESKTVQEWKYAGWKKNFQHLSNLDISCPAKQYKELYITAEGLVYPCCYLGSQKTYGNTSFIYDDVVHLLEKNNLSIDDINLNHRSLTEIIDQGYLEMIFSTFDSKEDRLKKCIETCSIKDKT